jgi:hypothetical protein
MKAVAGQGFAARHVGGFTDNYPKKPPTVLEGIHPQR